MNETQPPPTDAELLAEWDRVSHIADAGQRRLACLRAVLAKWGQPQAVAVGEPVDRVFIVATGEEHEGEATYTRYDHAPPPLCDSECLYTAPQPAVAAGWQRLITAPADEIVLVAAEFDRPGDWRIKCGYFDKQTTTLRVFGASWEPTHWMPLPPAPSSEGESNV